MWKRTDLPVQNWHEEFNILTWALKSLKNLHFDGLLLSKVYNVWGKKYRRVMFDGTEY